MYIDMKKMAKPVKQKKNSKTLTRRIGIEVVIMKKNCVKKK